MATVEECHLRLPGSIIQRNTRCIDAFQSITTMLVQETNNQFISLLQYSYKLVPLYNIMHSCLIECLNFA